MTPTEPGNEVIVIGELNPDLIVSGLGSFPALGQEIVAENFEITLGSASAIFASGLARLGRGVTFVSFVGDDDLGRRCTHELEKNGISAGLVQVSETGRTGVTIVISTPDDRAMITFPGLIPELSLADLSFEMLDGHRHLHLTSYFLQKKLQDDFAELMAEARSRGLTVSFDPNSDPEQKWDRKIFDVVRNTDVLFVNQMEAMGLTGCADIEMALGHLDGLCSTVVIKMGRLGAVASTNGVMAKVDGFKVDAIDTTGAGDSFAAGFVHASLDGKSLDECLEVANACGALSTRKAGGATAQANLDELEEFFGRKILSEEVLL